MDACNIIKDKQNVIFGKSGCYYTIQAKKLAKERGMNMYILDLDTVFEGDDMRRQLTCMYSHSTVPLVFVNGKFIGGYDSFLRY